MNIDAGHGNSNSNAKMSRLGSGLVSKMLTSWKMYQLLFLIFHAPDSVIYKAAEYNSKMNF